MSGIYGLVQADGRSIDHRILADALFLLERQGPDEQAYWISDNVALAHCRLDTVRGQCQERQPACSQAGDIWLSADARIDDQSQLINRLKAAGCDVSYPVTDVELVLLSYQTWKRDCLKYLIGDFAFVLWDRRERALFCATDQIGVCPLYYASVEGAIIVSNNLKAVRAHPAISDRLNEQAIGDYILFRMNHMPESTVFRDIRKLPPGHALSFNNGSLKVERYWSMPAVNHVRRSKSDLFDQAACLLRSAVEDRVRTKSVGTHLSGGMDSTSIAAVLAEQRDEGKIVGVHAYTYAQPEAHLNLEQPFAELAARKLDLPISVYPGDTEASASDLLDVADLPHEPSFASRDTPRFRIYRDSLEKSRTFFAGFGGDPLLAPVRDYWKMLLSNRQLGSYIADTYRYAVLHRRPHAHLVSLVKGDKARREKVTVDLPDWLNVEFVERNRLKERHEALANGRSVGPNARVDMGGHTLWRRIFEWHSPAYSGLPLKVRFPFFDVRLISWFQTVPDYPWLHNKYILRQMMNEKLPHRILNRPKTPLLKNPLRAKAENDAANDLIASLANYPRLLEYVDVSKLLGDISRSGCLTDTQARSIVRLSTLGHWLDNFARFNAYARTHGKELRDYKERSGEVKL